VIEGLLQTKLNIPPLRPDLVSRPQLIQQMDHGLELGHRLTLVSAPAGFGKTTLVADWVSRNNGSENREVQGSAFIPTTRRVAWLSLDEGDNDPARFLTYIVAAFGQLEGVASPIGKGALSMLQSPQPPPAKPILTSLINDIANIAVKIVFVLDDYHLIDSPAIDDALTFLLEHLPPQMHLVIATRTDPQLSLARLRARGQLTELRGAALRFTPAEISEFLNQMAGLDLSADDIAALDSRTEGWIAGLQLAAISMQGRKDVSSLIKSFTGSHRFVLDYLVDEVLERQSEAIRTFLLHTAVLDRITGSLCDALTGQNGSQATLEMLDHANLFIISMDEERLWYRYHHLFADLLRQRLRQREPDVERVLHLRAGEWFSQQGLDREAIKHWLLAEDYQGAADLIQAVAIDIMQQGEHTTVVGWINTIPEEVVTEQPYLCVLHAWALQLSGQLADAEARLVNAEEALESQQDRDSAEVDTILGLIHSHRAYLAFMIGELDQAIQYAQQALIQLPETAALIRAQTALYLGVAYRYQGNLQAAMEVYDETLPIVQGMGGKSIVVLCYLHLADLYWQLGQLHRSKEFCEQALRITEIHTGKAERPYTGFAYVRISRVLREWNQLEDAHRSIVKGVALCRDWNVADIMALSCIELATIQQALGDYEQARASMQEAYQIYESFSPWGLQIIGAYQAMMDLMAGEEAAAERWAQENDLVIDGEFEFQREIEYLALVRVFIAQRRFEEAYALANHIHRVAQDAGAKQTELEGLILLALVTSAQGEYDQAFTHLEKALALSEPEDFIRIYVDEGRPMSRLLYEALSRGIAPEYVSRLLAAFPAEGSEEVKPPKPQRAESGLVEPLSDRELEVLQYIATGLTNREIGQRLYLSLNTIKVHTRNLYGKLGVNSRTQAVAKARDLGILDSF
jgi:LuxR family maltose regulon positive regulatory protein